MTTPQSMKVVEIITVGSSEGLAVCDRPVPAVTSGELLVKVAAAGVNRADIMQRLGHYPPPSGASDILGLEVSGTVAVVGSGVAEWRVGDPACALLTGGGYAEYCVVPAPQCLPVPAGVDLVDAAGARKERPSWFMAVLAGSAQRRYN